MSKRKRQRRARGGWSHPSDPSRREPTIAQLRRRERKGKGQKSRDAARRRGRRSRVLNRALVSVGVAAVVSAAALLIISLTAQPQVSEEALSVGRQAGCGEVEIPASSAPGGIHSPGRATSTGGGRPATSGPHDFSPLPSQPRVFTRPIEEARAVHNLEHGYVAIYYRADGPDSLPSAVIEELSVFAENQEDVLMAPHPLPSGSALALAAWNRLWQCPPSITPQQASVVSSGFVSAFRNAKNAPEASIS